VFQGNSPLSKKNTASVCLPNCWHESAQISAHVYALARAELLNKYLCAAAGLITEQQQQQPATLTQWSIKAKGECVTFRYLLREQATLDERRRR
jgi:hypothetical protein